MSNRYVVLTHRRILHVAGADSRHFLQGLISQDITLVNDTHSIWAAMLTAQGKYLFDFFVMAYGEDLLLDCDDSQAEALRKTLTLYKLRADVKIEDWGSSHHVVAALGDLSPLSLPLHAGRTQHFHGGEIIAMVDPRSEEMAARIIAPAGEAETWVLQRGYAQASIDDYETHRITLGIPRAGIDNVPQKTLLLENGFEELHGVSFEKGCYVGQEVTARTKHRANLQKRLYIVQADEPLPPTGAEILLGERVVGDLRSSHGTMGLAVLRNEAVEKAANGEGTLTINGVAVRAESPSWRAN